MESKRERDPESRPSFFARSPHGGLDCNQHIVNNQRKVRGIGVALELHARTSPPLEQQEYVDQIHKSSGP